MRRGIGALLAGGVALVLAACNSDTLGREWEPFRVKVVAEVETPEGVRSGYNVTEVTCSAAGRALGTQGGSICRGRGEAIAVDLPKGETLFILVNRPEDGQPWSPEASIPLPGDPWSSGGDRLDQMGLYVEMISAAQGRHPVDLTKGLPWFVRFRDVKDPKTVEEVDPANLSKSYGKGYALRGITVEITDEPVTNGIGKRLNEMSLFPDRSLDNDFEMTTNPTLAQKLGHKDFVQGQTK